MIERTFLREFMEKKLFLLLSALVVALVFGASVLATSAVVQDDAQKTETKGVAQQCLACHGSFDKLAEATSDFKAASGETVTPHRYVPHEEKKDIPECTNCHKPHPIPLEDKSQVVKPNNLDWCYSNCHHAQNLQACSACH
jgi:hypothetical protein